MSAQDALRQCLEEFFAEQKAKDPDYSVNRLAKKLQVNQPAISEFLRGKRRISIKLATRILEQLPIPSEIRKQILSQFAEQVAPFQHVDEDIFRLVSEWHHFVIRSLTRVTGFSSQPKWIAQKLGLSEKKVQEAIDVLMRLQFLKYENGQLVHQKNIHTSDDIPSDAILRAHLGELDLAKQVLQDTHIDERDYTSITLAVNPEQLPEVKGMVRDFYRRLDNKFKQPPLRRVYKVCIQIFPTSKI